MWSSTFDPSQMSPKRVQLVRAYIAAWTQFLNSIDISVLKTQFLFRNKKHTVSPKHKPWLDQIRPDIFPNRAEKPTGIYFIILKQDFWYKYLYL